LAEAEAAAQKAKARAKSDFAYMAVSESCCSWLRRG